MYQPDYHGVLRIIFFFLSLSVRMFHNKISIWTSRFSKVDCLLECGWTSFNSLRAWVEQQVEEEGMLLVFLPDCLLELGQLILSSLARRLGFIPLASLVLRTSDLDWFSPLVFLVLLLILHNHVRQFCIINIYPAIYWFCFSGEP